MFAALLFAIAVDARIDQLLSKMTLEEKLVQLTEVTEEQLPSIPAGVLLSSGGAAHINEIQRNRKIPLLVGYDVIHGYRTIFPIPLAIASSWDPQLAELSARVAGQEARAAGVRWTYAPMVDIARDARWGRIAEGAGEDPVLGSAMAAAYVRGFQTSILACAKHYAAYGAAEAGRDYNTVETSERTLREVYLPPFHAAVDAGVATLMSAFESLNGVPATANRHLLDDILRREWKFKGFVVSDWDAVAELINHGVAANKHEAAIKAITAGVDVDMWDNSYATLRDGGVPEPVIDRAVQRVLRMKLRAGLFDQPLTDEKPSPPLNRDAARRVAQQSIVLLKNENDLLPLPKSGKKIAVVGPLADSKKDMLGPWSAEGKGEEAVTPLEAIPHVPLADADIIVAILGESREMSGEAASRTSIDLPDDQEKLLESLIATGKPVILVVMSGRPLAISWAAEHVPAIVQAWFLGTESGNAIADVLFGDVNPSAKLPVTFPRSTGQVPIYYNHLPTGRPPNPEDKYTSKYLDVPIGPLYPFGFGLSYTKFDYSDIRVDGFKVSANVRNAGNRAGEEIVQMYIGDPVASVSRPVKELKGFQRVSLQPNETKRVTFTIKRHDLEFWSDRGWTAEPGEFKVWIGPSSATGLEGKFELR
ncbi:MAG: glycosyl hydrolase [Acidobacteria bacterium]|nr:MAG: glycosyl hydrolase [Acidobacteriota bacterium]